MSPWMKIVVLPFIGVACASSTAAQPAPAVEAPTPRSAGLSEARTSERPSGEVERSDATALAKAGSGDSESVKALTPSADGKLAPSGEFPDRRAIEALDNVARTFAVVHEKGRAIITLSTDDFFETGAAALAYSARWRLDEIASALAVQVGRGIVIRGYTDSLGDRSESTALSLRRALAVRDYVVSKGARPDQIRAEGLGPDHPVADNTSPLGRATNRRIEIVIESPSTQKQADH